MNQYQDKFQLLAQVTRGRQCCEPNPSLYTRVACTHCYRDRFFITTPLTQSLAHHIVHTDYQLSVSFMLV
jgi:hypothetical protein